MTLTCLPTCLPDSTRYATAAGLLWTGFRPPFNLRPAPQKDRNTLSFCGAGRAPEGAGQRPEAPATFFVATPRTVACLASLSMGFPREEYWSGLPFPSSGDLPDPGIKPTPLKSATVLYHCIGSQVLYH